ncbi:hypothetical protein LCGC14_2720270 [marine sediment metagenome]|uniref:Uncharacterized protein n=1 Tax=marine sediment metagenome TaxID=412755 RepID=A0A0F8ZXW7_9ZZZZ
MEVIIDVILRKTIDEDDEDIDHPDTVREREREVIVEILNPLLELGWEIVIPLTRIAR